jgi:hypothetical protein
VGTLGKTGKSSERLVVIIIFLSSVCKIFKKLFFVVELVPLVFRLTLEVIKTKKEDNDKSLFFLE